MSISFYSAPKAPRRAASAPTTTSLLNRIEKPPLAERLSRLESTEKPPSGPCVTFYFLNAQSRPFYRRTLSGPARSKPARGAQKATPKSAPKGPKKPKTAEELDKELDAFMGDAETAPEGAGSVTALADGDMEVA